MLASHHDGKELNSPNDVVVKSDGAIYFSDPTYGRKEHFGVPREPQLAFRGVYRARARTASRSRCSPTISGSRTACASRSTRRCCSSTTPTSSTSAPSTCKPDGTLANSRIWAKTVGEGAGAPDGMKIDSAGNLYCCGPGGIHVFAPDATCLGVIKVPEYTANFCWGDDDLKSLFITASTSLYRIRVAVPGTPQMQ